MRKILDRKIARYPEKKTINLVIREKDINSPSRALPVFLLILLGIGIFCKFAVLRPLAEVASAWQQVAELETQVNGLKQQQEEYAALSEQYRRYGTGWMTAEEAALLDRIEILSLLEQYLMKPAYVHYFKITDNTLSVNVSGMTLEQASVIREQLQSDAMVQSVQVYTASNNEETIDAYLAMTITLQQPDEGGIIHE